MKRLLWLAVFLLCVSGVVLCSLYFWVARDVPPLNSEFDLQTRMKQRVEAERKSLGGTMTVNGGIDFQPPDRSKLPTDLVVLYLSQLGCPGYLQTLREDGAAWSWRVVDGALFHGAPAGDGQCERALAMQVAAELDIRDPLQQSIAARRIHAFLTKDQLLAFALSGLVFARGVVGPDAAARDLFGRPLEQLRLSELAELVLAFPAPVGGYWDDLKTCKNPSLLRQGRDGILERLGHDGLVPEERVKSAQAQPLACLHP